MFIEESKLSIRCEEELRIDDKTISMYREGLNGQNNCLVVKRFTRRIPIPAEKLNTEMIATEMNS